MLPPLPSFYPSGSSKRANQARPSREWSNPCNFRALRASASKFFSCTLTEVGQSADCRMLVHSVGDSSQWGKIRATLVSEPTQTPLQEKLDKMAKLIG